MKSKTFYSDFHKASFMKQLWIMGLTAFGYFMVMLVPLVIMFNNEMGEYRSGTTLQWKYHSMILQADASYVFLVGLAVFMAIVQFGYLHSGREMDFYGSLPVKRETLLSWKVLFSYIDFVVPYTVILAVCMLLGMWQQVLTKSLVIYILEMWLVNQMGFLLILMVAVLVMLLTGRKWVAVSGMAVLLFGGYFADLLLEALKMEFFSTYYVTGEMSRLSYLSPVFVVYQLREGIFFLEDTMKLISAEFVGSLAAVFAAAAILFRLNCCLVKKRPAEKAGQSMAFSVPSRVIHMVLSIFLGICIGLFIMAFVYYNEMIWFFAGSLFGGFIIYTLVQFIYTLDIKKTFYYKWQLIAAEAVIMVVCAVFAFDLVGYDAYVPAQNELESYAIRYHDSNAHMSFYVNDRHYDGVDYTLDTMVLEPDEETYDMLQKIASEKSGTENVYVNYRLENGREIKRCYRFTPEEYRNTFIKLYDQNVFREYVVPTLMVEGYNCTSANVYYAGYEHELYRTEEGKTNPKADAFVDAYNRDISKLDGSVFVEEMPIGMLDIRFVDENRYYPVEVPVYEECTETLSLLKERGHELSAAVVPENVKRIVVEDYSWEYMEYEEPEEEFAVTMEMVEMVEYPTYEFTDKEEIARILSCLADGRYGTIWQNRDCRYRITVYMEPSEDLGGIEAEYYADFLADRIPTEMFGQ